MPHIEFDKYRNLYAWRIMESDRYIFHIEPSNLGNSELEDVLKDADSRYNQIINFLDINKSNLKDKEKLFKYNYWIHNSEIAIDSGMPIEGNNRFHGQGSASIQGIDYVVYDDSWNNHIRHVLHEEVHLNWMNEVGEAPSILNEGIAIYAEDILSDGQAAFKKRLCNAWKDSMVMEKGLLKKLMGNQYFWSNYGKLPVYTIGAALTWFIIDQFGMAKLKEIFINSYFFDECLDGLIEKKTGMTIDDIESSITNIFSLQV